LTTNKKWGAHRKLVRWALKDVSKKRARCKTGGEGSKGRRATRDTEVVWERGGKGSKNDF